jgi:hypothetical protein
VASVAGGDCISWGGGAIGMHFIDLPSTVRRVQTKIWDVLADTFVRLSSYNYCL